MALIKCPECGKEVSDKASSCPNCGHPIEDQTVEVEEYSNKEIVNPLPKKSKKKVIFFIAIITVIIIAGVIAYFMIVQPFNKENIIIGEWKLSGLSMGDRHMTVEQLENLGIQIQGQASFTEEGFVFSLENLETVGTWKEVDDKNDDNMNYYELTSDGGDVTVAVIDKETNWLYIAIANDEDSMVILEKQ